MITVVRSSLCTHCKLCMRQSSRLINRSLRAGLLLVWPMCCVCPTVLGAGPADESIMRLSIDEMKCIHVLCKRSRAAVLQSGMINSIRPSPLHRQVTQRASCYNTTDHFRKKTEELELQAQWRLQGPKPINGKRRLCRFEVWGKLKT